MFFDFLEIRKSTDLNFFEVEKKIETKGNNFFF